ncbi:MAG: ATP-dependent sacrificial sulfur transferase LarE, partial [Candidatus Electrothrix sp. AUS4]|nr:ATP-dependent sacrificial sulfur transferase LarE [Candidatus Electrothrix sp. AUS4]
LSRFDRVGVAFSGGVDSSFLLRMVLDALGPHRVLPLYACSCLQTKQEQENVLSWAEHQKYPAAAMQVRIMEINPLHWKEFTANPENRCYLCKRKIYTTFLETLREDGMTALLDGTNADDLRQGENGRPGLRALKELGIHTPLADCGLNKEDIRKHSRALGLHTADRPSASCLATRIPHGMLITPERLQKIAELEQTLEKEGLVGCRVRLNANAEQTVLVQLQQSDLGQVHNDFLRKHLIAPLKKKGVHKIYLDVEGR